MVSSRVQNFVSENAQRALDFSAQLDQESMELAYKLDERRSSQIKNAKWDYWSSSAYHRFRHWDPTNHLLDDLEDEYKSTLLEDQLMLNSTGGLRGLDGYVGRIGRRWSSRPELPSNICRYFNRGFCKNGRHCRFLHEDPCSMLSPSGNELDEHIISPQSLEELEVEIIELLKSRRRNPVSIASLPMLYYDKYGKGLQAEGYLTESQRHGKVGYSLTKLLARLKNSIRLIDKPNGQHSVILAEDVPKYIEYFGEKEDTGAAGSRQIYLTFPPDSSFTEKDVSDYFENFGPVQDVRIPCQEKRMFGFVTFVHPETVQEILSKDSSHHYVCGARILAKRYREKTRPSYRKQSSKYQRQMDCQKIQFLRACESIRMRQVMEVQKRAFEQEQISMMETLPEHLIQSAYFGRNGISSTQTHLAEQEESQYPSAGLLTHLLDSKNPTVSVDDNNVPQDDTISLNLPESLF